MSLEIGQGPARQHGGREVGRLVLDDGVQPGEAEGDIVSAGEVAQAHGRAAAPGDDGRALVVGEAHHLRHFLHRTRQGHRLGHDAIHRVAGRLLTGEDALGAQDGLQLVVEDGLLDQGGAP